MQQIFARNSYFSRMKSHYPILFALTLASAAYGKTSSVGAGSYSLEHEPMVEFFSLGELFAEPFSTSSGDEMS